jgi:hypothetical protein
MFLPYHSLPLLHHLHLQLFRLLLSPLISKRRRQVAYEKQLDVPANGSDLRELACILEYMPLAIVQAVAYIQQQGARYSVWQYIKAFQRNEKQKTSLLNYEAGHLRRDSEAKDSILIIWQISFDDIQEKWPSSADLLSLMSDFVDNTCQCGHKWCGDCELYSNVKVGGP